MLNYTRDELLIKAFLTPDDLQEIQEMPIPDENQVKGVLDMWEHVKEEGMHNEHTFFNWIMTGKLFLKCRQSRPEYFI